MVKKCKIGCIDCKHWLSEVVKLQDYIEFYLKGLEIARYHNRFVMNEEIAEAFFSALLSKDNTARKDAETLVRRGSI